MARSEPIVRRVIRDADAFGTDVHITARREPVPFQNSPQVTASKGLQIPGAVH